MCFLAERFCLVRCECDSALPEIEIITLRHDARTFAAVPYSCFKFQATLTRGFFGRSVACAFGTEITYCATPYADLP